MKSAIVLVVLVAAAALGDAFIVNSKQTLSRKRRLISGGLGLNILDLVDLTLGIGRTTARPAISAPASPSATQSPAVEEFNPNHQSDVDSDSLAAQETGSQTPSGNNNRPGLGASIGIGSVGISADFEQAIGGDLNLKMLMVEDGSPKGKCYCSCSLNNQPVFMEIDPSTLPGNDMMTVI